MMRPDPRRRWTCEHCKADFSTVVRLELTRHAVPANLDLPLSQVTIWCLSCLETVGGYYVAFHPEIPGNFSVQILRSGADQARVKSSLEVLSNAIEEHLAMT